MKRKHTFLITAMALMIAIIGSSAKAWGQTKDVAAYTLTPATGSNNSYTGNCDITISGIKWNVTGNSQQIPWRLGGKKSNCSETDRPIYSKTAITDDITKITVTHGPSSETGITVNSFKLDVYSIADLAAAGGTGDVSSITGEYAENGSYTFNRPAEVDWSGRFYRFTYNLTVSVTSNKYISFAEAIFYKSDGGTSVSTPYFTPAAGEVVSGTEVSIATSTEGASIYYTLDGTAPTSSSTLYENPIAITAETTIKAIAIKSGLDDSEIASASYTLVVMRTFAEAKQAYDDAGGDVYNYYVSLAGAQIAGVYGKNMYVQKDNVGLCLFQNSDWSDYTQGDVFNEGAYAKGTVTQNKGLYELSSPEINGGKTSGSITARATTIADINADFYSYESQYVEISDVNIESWSLKDGENTLAMYDGFNTGYSSKTAPEATDAFTVKGIAGICTTKQLQPTAIADISTTVVTGTPTFTPAPSTDPETPVETSIVTFTAATNTRLTVKVGDADIESPYVLTDDVTMDVTAKRDFYTDFDATYYYKKADAVEYDIEIDGGITNGTVETNVNKSVAGAEITITVTPDGGYKMKDNSLKVIDNDANEIEISETIPYTFIMPESDVFVSAEFELIPTLTITWSVNGVIESLSPSSIEEGGTINELPTPTNISEGFDFAGWTESESNIQILKAPVTVGHNVTYYAVFTKGYELLTSAPEDWSGKYLIVADNAEKLYAFNQTIESKWGKTSEVTATNNIIESSETTNGYSFTIGAGLTSGKYYIQMQDCKYISGSAKGTVNTQDSQSTANTDFTLSLSGNRVSIIASSGSNRKLMYNYYNGSGGFRFYDDNTSQILPFLYKLVCYTRVFLNENASSDITIAGPSIIPAGSTLNMGSYALTNSTAADLIIENGAQLILADDNAGVQATIKKNIEKSGTSKDSDTYWYSIGSPLAANVEFTNVTNLIPNEVTDTDYDLYRLNEEDGIWENSRVYDSDKTTIIANPDFTTIDKGRGYIYANTSTTTDIAFAGEINVDDVEMSVTVGDGKGYNLIGNPFMQNIKLADVEEETAALANGFYVLNHDNSWGTMIETGTVAPLQGFLVQATEAGDVTISKPEATSKDERSDEQNANIEIIVANSNYSDNVYAMFSNGIGLNKINHRNAEAPMIYIPQDGADFAVAMMDESVTVFPVSFKAMTIGYYTISIKSSQIYEGLNDFDYLHLVDNMTGEEIDMLLEDSYRFVGSPADNANRFTVKLHRNGIEENGFEDVSFVYRNGKSLIISGEGTFQIIDMLGRIVISKEVHGETMSVDNLITGAYIVRMIGNEVKTQKIIVR